MTLTRPKFSQKFQRTLIGLATLAFTLPNFAMAGGEVSTAQLLQSSYSPSCAEWRVKGICIWLTCTPYGCYTRTSVKVRHFLPESVVSFLSGLAFLEWRMSTLEMFHPSSFTPFVRELRKGGDNWGNIYPRNGMVTQQHSYKGVALVAQRVADIVTRPFGQSTHLYIPLAQQSQPSNGKWYPKPVQELKRQNHKWQMLYPKMEKSCAIFPDKSSSGVEVTDPYQDKISKNHNYAWALWRPYECCKRRGQTLIFSN